jgi:hypothetical protein
MQAEDTIAQDHVQHPARSSQAGALINLARLPPVAGALQPVSLEKFSTGMCLIKPKFLLDLMFSHALYVQFTTK